VDEASAPFSFSTAAGRASPCLRLPSLAVPSPWSGSAAEVVCYLLDDMGSNHASQLLATAINPCRMPPARYITQPHRRCPFSQHAVVGSRCCYLHPSHSPCSTKMPPRSLTSGGCTLVVAAPCPSTRSPSVSPLAQQPRRLRALSARCFVKPVDSTPSTLAGCLLFLRSPIRDVVETRGEKTPAALAAIILFIFCFVLCSVKMLNCCVCLIAASGRRRASRLARSMKYRAMWTAHASSHDPFRLIDL
jgi:hypothetical protein